MEEFESAKDPLTHKIIGCCYEVHKELGPGFLEKIYSKALIEQLKSEKINYELEREFNVFFKKS